MNVLVVPVTDDAREMIRFGEKIVAEKSSYYNEQAIERIMAQIRTRIPDDSSGEAERTFFKSVYYYWAYGCDVSEYFYYDFANKRHDEIKKYITKKEKVIYTNRLNKIEDAHLLQNKYETYRMFQEDYLRDILLCESEEDYGDFLSFVRKHPVFVVKPLKLGGGQGIRKDDVLGLTEPRIREKFLSLLSETGKINSALNSWGGNPQSFILEEVLEQDERMAVLHPQSLNVIRIPTLSLGSGIQVYQPWLKTGVGGNFVNNGYSGGLLAGIDVRRGMTDTPGFSEEPAVYDKHPDTGIPLEGFQIPEWEQLLQTAERLSRRLPTIRYVSWDMALTPRGWAVIEGNFRGAFMWQFFRRRGMKAEFEALTGIRLQREFWWEEE